MKVVAIAVVSINGKITRGKDSNIYSWTSKEDSDFFFSKISTSKLIVMGSSTYEAVRDRIKPEKGRLRIVLTRTPRKYSKDKVEGSLEFLSQDPLALVQSLEKKGYREMLLVGGSKIYSAFLKENLIDEIYLTIEPLVFGDGKQLFAKGDFAADLSLIKVKKLNHRGSLLLKYKVNFVKYKVNKRSFQPSVISE